MKPNTTDIDNQIIVLVLAIKATKMPNNEQKTGEGRVISIL